MPNSKLGEGVHDVYKERARQGGDVLWHCKIRGQSELAEGIPLHMSLKVFSDKNDMDLEEIKKKVEDLEIKTPDPKKLKFSTKIFTSEFDGKKYYMLIIDGVDENYSKFYDEMKHCGTVYKAFMPHVTIDQNLYDSINEKPLQADEVEFNELSVEHGAGNTIYEFNKLEKGFVRNAAIGLSLATGVLGLHREAKAPAPTHQASVAKPYSSQRMLNTIASVESSNGKQKGHATIDGGVHHGEAAYGKYGLMPNTIRETIKLNRDLKSKHQKAMSLKGKELANYMEDNPGLEDQVAGKYLARLEHHFGNDRNSLSFSWLNGIKGTYDAKKKNKNLEDHWYVKRHRKAWEDGK